MPVTIDTTIGGANANSYVTVDQFNSYKEANSVDLYAQDDPDKAIRCLVIAANRLNRENWLGSQATTTQRLKWPRIDVEKPDQPGGYLGWTGYGGGYGRALYESTEIPQLVKDAQCEIAMGLEKGEIANSQGGVSDIAKWSADGVTIEYRDSAAAKATSLPDRAMELIADLIAGNTLVRS